MEKKLNRPRHAAKLDFAYPQKLFGVREGRFSIGDRGRPLFISGAIERCSEVMEKNFALLQEFFG